MSELQGAFLASIGIGLIICILVFIIEGRAFAKTGNAKYSLLRYFPFELNCFKRNSKVSYVYPIALFVGTLLISSSYLFFALETQQKGGAMTVAYIMFAISCITALAYNALTFIKLSNYQMHLIFAVFFVCLNLLEMILSLFFLPNNNYFYVNAPHQATQIVVFIVSFLLLIFEAILMFNPSYKRWNKMVKVDAETFNRPRYNYLAMLEWGNFIIYILNLLPVGIVMFF